MSNESSRAPSGATIDYVEFQARPEFQEMRSRFRGFVFPLTAAFMIWFLLYVILGAYAHDFMARPLLGMNVGLWLGLLQFVSTFAITMWYVSWANRRLDPLTENLRGELEEIEGAAQASAAAPGSGPEAEPGAGFETDGGAR